MITDVFQNRLNSYTIDSKQAEENAIKEICQEIALAGLARENFFKHAMFQGGTCLRIIYGLQRFSEDLDFILMKPDRTFNWGPYFRSIKLEFESVGLSLDVIDRSKADSTIKKAFLKEGSFGKVLNLHYSRARNDQQKILIKLEIDTNPPTGSIPEIHILDYPYPFSIVTQDLPSLFAGKCHALLCREYVKGRDWFDFIWYVQNRSQVNYLLLKNALEQSGPYANTEIAMSKDWLVAALKQKIVSMDWKLVAGDVVKFISSQQQHAIQLWNRDLFKGLVEKLNAYLD